MPTTSVTEVPTETGPGRLHVTAPDDVRGLVVLGGGASGQIGTTDLDALAAGLPAHGWAVARFELPWRVAGRRIGPRPPASDADWDTGVTAARARYPDVPVVTGGRSAGARIACRTWAPDLAGIVALSFPLHPPGKPEKSRLDELRPVGVGVLLVSGTTDPFGSAAELDVALQADHAGPRTLVTVPGATHSFPKKVTPAVLAAVVAFLGPLS